MDYKIDSDKLDCFKRVINNQEYLFKDGCLVYKLLLENANL